MKVVAEAPWSWFLFEDGAERFLDVLIEHGAVSFSATVRLDEDQVAAYALEGERFLNALASDVRNAALMRQSKQAPLPSGWSERSVDAVREWKER